MLDWKQLIKVNEEVYHSSDSLIDLTRQDIDELIRKAKLNKRKRIRICAHKNTNETVQEMLIIHPQDTYVRPHKHLNKIESMLVLYGEVEYIVYSDSGEILKRIEMGEYESDQTFFHSTRESFFHSLMIKSEWLVFLEITQGPFKREDTVFADWSPVETELDEVKKFQHQMKYSHS
mgnify:CR=1 FL=1